MIEAYIRAKMERAHKMKLEYQRVKYRLGYERAIGEERACIDILNKIKEVKNDK